MSRGISVLPPTNDATVDLLPPLPLAGGSTPGGTVGSLWIAAGSMRASLSNGCSVLTQVPLGVATAPDILTLNFDPSSVEYAEFSITTDGQSTFTFTPYWSHAATTTNFGVVWSMDALAVGNGEDINVARGTAGTSTDTGGSTNYLYVGPTSASITIAGSPTADDLVFFRIYRSVANGSDTMAIDARLHGIILTW